MKISRPEPVEQNIPENELILVNAFDLAITRIEEDSNFIASCLRQATIKWTNPEKEAQIIFRNGYDFHFERTKLEKEKLADELIQILGKDITLDIILSKDLKTETNHQEEKNEMLEVNDNLTEDISEEDEFMKALKKNIKVKKIEILQEDKNGKKT